MLSHSQLYCAVQALIPTPNVPCPLPTTYGCTTPPRTCTSTGLPSVSLAVLPQPLGHGHTTEVRGGAWKTLAAVESRVTGLMAAEQEQLNPQTRPPVAQPYFYIKLFMYQPTVSIAFRASKFVTLSTTIVNTLIFNKHVEFYLATMALTLAGVVFSCFHTLCVGRHRTDA